MAKKIRIVQRDNLPQEKVINDYANELIIAYKEMAFQNIEKEKRATELIIANKELAYQNKEKEKRATELIIANKELALQVIEKEKRAAELIIANKELAYQNIEKEKRAAELVIANQELAFQNLEKEKRATELLIANKELASFAYISNHDLQEPLRKIQAFSGRILEEEDINLSVKGKYSVERTKSAAHQMQKLINDLLIYWATTGTQRKFENTDLSNIVSEVMAALKKEIQETEATIEVHKLSKVTIIPFQFRQLLQNLIHNALKFNIPGNKPHIIIKCDYVKYDKSNDKKFILNLDYHHITVSDNGIGFDTQYQHKIF